MPRFLTATPTRNRAPSHSPPDVQFAPGLKLAKRLGWFSLALGATQILAPKMMCRATRIQNESLMMACGVREMICGVGILVSSRPAGWMWGRVAGDGMDLGVLGAACVTGNSCDTPRALLSTAVVAGVMTFDALVAAELTAAEAFEG